jgi:hypothetical protein
MPVVVIGAVVGLLFLVWGGVEVDRLVTEHPIEWIFVSSCVAVIVVSSAVARLRTDNRRVPLDRPVRGTVIEAAPVRPAIRTAPAPPRPTPPPLPPAPMPPKVGEKCDGPRCEEILDDDPWDCGGIMPDGHEVSGQFHSRPCMDAWQRMIAERHKAPHS